jgi:prevent-host-death family protein
MGEQITVAEAHNRISQWLKKAKDGPITITRRGKPVGVIVDPEEYERLRRVQGYLQMRQISHTLAERDVAAEELYRAARDELEERP